ncbi:hypothetical protein DBT_0587 [Dissulfuribacter thermophilus]|uniref:Flagellar basal-body/hook protein C-terminal domain-containing protein n=1 Tax=Dissulfuribacter thermophilus TaxID=1156395 RepID=A0A1B9F8J2_9BACT|nr:flagellar basal body rod C-terminal domain-containing protein [Dissulfuribacter thermophilus]OCC16125.1 hypothetical protein DBT_0587 [Dissulfuribacter thermophilus]
MAGISTITQSLNSLTNLTNKIYDSQKRLQETFSPKDHTKNESTFEPSKEIVEQISLTRAFEANLKVIETENERIGTVIDIKV